MPELPEVETIARTLRPQLLGQTILEADIRWARTVAMPAVKKFKEQIKGQQIKDVSRRAKFLNIQLSNYNLFTHLRMSGDVLVKEGKIQPEKHDRLVLLLSAPSPAQKPHAEDGGWSSLVFNDTRKFGRVWLTKNIEDVLGQLGPEPLDEA
ncbi:MAG: DNA-formamidopyrimidine glycosylase, partial [Chloroflexi bacterium]|nr:DNA-formamidopyrimidine glycosylase [Chloroflexota bacterium]